MDERNAADRERLEHISEAAGLILRFCEGKSEDDFLTDLMLQSSVLYQFIVVGEAVRFLDPMLLEQYAYPWHLPRSFRNYIAHEYFGINLKKVSNTVKLLLPEFKELIDRMIRDLGRDKGETDAGSPE